MTASITRDDLIKFLETTGHPPRLAALSEAARQSGDCGS
jgi:hypothetical protein